MDLPEGLVLWTEWLSPDDESWLAAWIDRQPWVGAIRRRTQHYGYRYDYREQRSGADLCLGPVPPILTELGQRAAVFTRTGPFDQVIVNEYRPGQGIHVDRPDSFGPTVVSISLLAGVVMRFTRDEGARVDLELPPRSLLCLTGPARYAWRHSIPARDSDPTPEGRRPRARRLSVTFRQMRSCSCA